MLSTGASMFIAREMRTWDGNSKDSAINIIEITTTLIMNSFRKRIRKDKVGGWMLEVGGSRLDVGLFNLQLPTSNLQQFFNPTERF